MISLSRTVALSRFVSGKHRLQDPALESAELSGEQPGATKREASNSGGERHGEGGFAPTFKEAVGRWRRRHRHPPPNETWFAVHYRVGWLVERLTLLESIHLLRQGLDVRSLAAERPARRKKGETGEGRRDDDEGIDVEDEPADAIAHRQPRTGPENAG